VDLHSDDEVVVDEVADSHLDDEVDDEVEKVGKKSDYF
jgi:hypothetical protein